MFDTIAAISSGMINQPISIIRLSGVDVLTIAQSIFSSQIETVNKMTLGYILNGAQKLDEVLLVYYQGPHSFTGEDMIEIYAHGGVFNTGRILQLILSKGVRHANPGEFSLRAVLNQKMDLVKAEAIHDLIFAKTETQVDLSIKKFNGQTQELFTALKADLLNLIAVCEVNIDYPEYDDIEILTSESIKPKIDQMLQQTNQIIETSKRFKHVFEGIRIAIVGEPNSGKSSLLNALLNEDKAIISNQAGTTRDVVEGQINLGSILLNFKDTAGIHLTNDELENKGIEKSLIEVQKADLVLHLVDGSKSNDKIKELILPYLKTQKYLKVINKKDLIFNDQFKPDEVYISALNGEVDALLDAIKKMFPTLSSSEESYVLNSVRQLALLDQAYNHLKTAKENLEQFHNTPDTIILDLQAAWTSLGNILGHVNHDTLLDEIFKNFCLGK